MGKGSKCAIIARNTSVHTVVKISINIDSHIFTFVQVRHLLTQLYKTEIHQNFVY